MRYCRIASRSMSPVNVGRRLSSHLVAARRRQRRARQQVRLHHHRDHQFQPAGRATEVRSAARAGRRSMRSRSLRSAASGCRYFGRQRSLPVVPGPTGRGGGGPRPAQPRRRYAQRGSTPRSPSKGTALIAANLRADTSVELFVAQSRFANMAIGLGRIARARVLGAAGALHLGFGSSSSRTGSRRSR